MDDTMEQMVDDYFELESFGVKLAPQVAASDDERAQRILEDTTVKVGRRYQTGLLWKDDYAVLPRSYETADQRREEVEAQRAVGVGIRSYHQGLRIQRICEEAAAG